MVCRSARRTARGMGVASIAGMAKRRKIDPTAAELAAATSAVLAQVSPKDLCTVPIARGSYMLRSGLYYDAKDSYPVPPVRHSTAEHASCADCADFARWRLAYEEWATEQDVAVLPVMVAPATIEHDGLAPVPHLTDPPHKWVAFVGAMIALAQ